MTSLLTTGLPGQTHPLVPGLPTLLIHAPLKHAQVVGGLCAEEQVGAVFKISTKNERASLRSITEAHEKFGGNAPHMIFDADEYSGKRRSIGADSMDPAFVRAQHNAGATWAMTNSGYIPEGNAQALRSVLRTGSRMGRHVLGALPLHHSWLKAGAKTLIEEINAAGIPVAIMLEHSADPFGARDTVRGFVRLLFEAEVPVVLLRSDMSVVGAVAWGAAAGAFGTSTGLRHIYPSTAGGGGNNGRPPSIAALVPRTMGLTSLERIADAAAIHPGPTWVCNCFVCYGRSIEWIATEQEAFQHSLAGVIEIAHYVLDSGLSPVERRQTWASRCTSAQLEAMELGHETGTDWPEPRFLGAWVAQPLPVSV